MAPGFQPNFSLPKWGRWHYSKNILERRLGLASPGELGRVAALRAKVSHLPVVTTTCDGESTATETWQRLRLRFRQLVATDDPRRFLKWDVIRQTMFVGTALYT